MYSSFLYAIIDAPLKNSSEDALPEPSLVRVFKFYVRNCKQNCNMSRQGVLSNFKRSKYESVGSLV